MVAPPAATGALEGVEALQDQEAQPAGTGSPRGEGPRVGQHPQGLLAHSRFRSTSAAPPQCLLARAGTTRIWDATRTAGCRPARPVVWEGRG